MLSIHTEAVTGNGLGQHFFIISNVLTLMVLYKLIHALILIDYEYVNSVDLLGIGIYSLVPRVSKLISVLKLP